MKSLLIKNTILYGLGNVSNGLIALFLLPVLTKTFLPEQYGLIELISITILIISTVAGLNLEAAILRFFSNKDRQQQRNIFSTIIVTSVISGLIFTLVSIGLFRLFKIGPFYHAHELTSVYIALAAIPFMVFLTDVSAFLIIQKKALLFIAISFFKILFTFLFTVVLIRSFSLGIKSVFIANLGIHVFLSIVCLFYFRSYFTLSFSAEILKKSVSFSLPLLFSHLIIFLLSNVNKYFLEFFHGSESVGIFTVGQKICMCLGMLGASFRQAWVPHVFSLIDQDHSKLIYNKAFRLFILVFFAASFLLVVLGKSIITFIASNKYLFATTAMGYICAAIICVNLSSSFFSLGIQISKKTKLSAWAYIAGLTVNIIFNLLLIPQYSIVGAGIALFLGSLTTLLLLLFFSNRVHKIYYDLKLLFFIFTAFLIFVVIWNRAI